MNPHQKNLINNVGNLLSSLKNSDAHVGVLTTTVDGTRIKENFIPGMFIGPKIDGTLDDSLSQLSAIFDVGTSGSAVESPFQSVLLALSPAMAQGVNKDFLRPGVPLKIIFVTDAEDQSLRTSGATSKDLTAADFMGELVKLKGDIKIEISGLIAIPTADGVQCVGDQGSSSPLPAKIQSVISMTGGRAISLCEPDWSKIGAL